MVCCLESVEPQEITQHVTSFIVPRKREQAHDIYTADDWCSQVIIPSLNGDCISITQFVSGSLSHRSSSPITASQTNALLCGYAMCIAIYSLIIITNVIIAGVHNKDKSARVYINKLLITRLVRTLYTCIHFRLCHKH